MNSKPNDIIDISAITSIYRPGPLGANVDKAYIKAKKNKSAHYVNDVVEEITKETYGFDPKEQLVDDAISGILGDFGPFNSSGIA